MTRGYSLLLNISSLTKTFLFKQKDSTEFRSRLGPDHLPDQKQHTVCDW